MNLMLGQELVGLRRAHNKTLRTLAREVDVSAALLSLIERGKHVPNRELVVRLAKALDADADRLCGMCGRITAEAEQSFAALARSRPEFFRYFRTLIDRTGDH